MEKVNEATQKVNIEAISKGKPKLAHGHYFKKHYGNERTAADNLKRLSLLIITQWMKMAWDSIDPAIIIKSFKKCSISNYLDGVENILWV